MNARIVMLASALLVLATGCGTMRSRQVNLRSPSAAKGPAALYMDGQETSLTAPFEEVAILQSDGTGRYSSPESVTDALRDRAGELGCDAVIKVRVAVDYSRTIGTGICVRMLR